MRHDSLGTDLTVQAKFKRFSNLKSRAGKLFLYSKYDILGFAGQEAKLRKFCLNIYTR